MTKITLLGTGTCNLTAERAAASVLVEIDGLKLVYDFGRGTATRLAELGLKQDDIACIFLSHFHPDHVTDLLPYLHAASWSQIDRRTKDLVIYGPMGVESFIAKLLAMFDPQELQRGYMVQGYKLPDEPWSIGGHKFEVVDLHHSRGLRFGSCAIAGDAELSEDLVAFLRGSELAIFDAGHINDEQISELAAATQVPQLICSHQYRPLDEVKLNAMAHARRYTGRIVVGQDLMEFVL